MTFQPTGRSGIETTNMNLKTDKWWSLRGSNPLPPTCKEQRAPTLCSQSEWPNAVRTIMVYAKTGSSPLVTGLT